MSQAPLITETQLEPGPTAERISRHRTDLRAVEAEYCGRCQNFLAGIYGLDGAFWVLVPRLRFGGRQHAGRLNDRIAKASEWQDLMAERRRTAGLPQNVGIVEALEKLPPWGERERAALETLIQAGRDAAPADGPAVLPARAARYDGEEVAVYVRCARCDTPTLFRRDARAVP